MLNKRIFSVLLTAALLTGLAACGSGDVQVQAGAAGESGAQLVSLSLTPSDPLIAQETDQQFVATGIYSDNTTKDLTDEVTWSSSDTNVATIDTAAAGSIFLSSGAATRTYYHRGHAHGRASGRTRIRATRGDTSAEANLTVTPATLVSISITPSYPEMAKGSTLQFTAVGTFSDNTTQEMTSSVTWSSSNTGAATIDASGLAASAAAGPTTITATAGTLSGSTVLTVTPATLASITVTPANPSIAKGTKQQFTATGAYSDNTTQDLTASVTWSSSNTGAATIDASGLAASVAAGSTTIKAASGAVSGTTTLTVKPATLASITVSPANASIAKGTKQQFTATGSYSDGSTQNLTATVAWSSSNTAVATISNAAGSNGLAASLTSGSTTIKAASGAVSATATLTVTPATLLSLTVTPANPGIAKGTKQQFTATGIYSDGSSQNMTTTVTWSSSAPSVATVSNASGSKGLAASVAAGWTTITAVSGSVSASTELTVTAATLSSIAVTPASSSVAQGASQQFIATGTFSDGTTQNLTAAAVWSSSNSGVAAVSNAADSKGLAAALAAGTTTITAVSGSISGSASLTVTAPAPVPAPGSTTLSWTAPSQRVDGSPITNLAGYRLYYGTSSGNYTAVQDLGNVTTLNLAALSLGQGTYYFVLTAYDIQNYESGYSTEISRTIQ